MEYIAIIAADGKRAASVMMFDHGADFTTHESTRQRGLTPMDCDLVDGGQCYCDGRFLGKVSRAEAIATIKRAIRER